MLLRSVCPRTLGRNLDLRVLYDNMGSVGRGGGDGSSAGGMNSEIDA